MKAAGIDIPDDRPDDSPLTSDECAQATQFAATLSDICNDIARAKTAGDIRAVDRRVMQFAAEQGEA
jgi:hypothetical protein